MSIERPSDPYAGRGGAAITDFGNAELMGLRDIASFTEDCQTMKVGDTHVAMVLMDYRNRENVPRFLPLIAALGKAQIKDLLS